MFKKILQIQEKFEDTKGVIRRSKSKDRQHNGQNKKDKRTNNDTKHYTDNKRSSNANPTKNSCAPEGLAVHVSLVTKHEFEAPVTIWK